MSIDSALPDKQKLTRREGWILAAHAILFVIFFLPFVPHETLPLADYNNHLARSFITHDPELVSGIYQLKWGIAPYFADLLPQLFIGMFGVYTAAKINFFIGLFTIVAGVLLISRRVCGQISPATLIVYVFLYNLATMLGFVNYNLAMGLALISFYLWISYPDKMRHWLIVTTLLTANFLLHALSYGVLVLVISIYEFWPLRVKDRIWCKRVLFFAIALIPQFILLYLAPHETIAEGNDFGTWVTKAQSVFSPGFFTFSLKDMLVLPAFIALFFLGVLKLSPRFRPVMIICVVISALIPYKFLGISLLDIRIPIFMTILACATSTWTLDRKKFVHETILAVFCLLALFRQYDNTAGLLQCGDMYDKYIETLRKKDIEPGSPVLLFTSQEEACLIPNAYNHANALTVIENQAFIPNLFMLMPPVKASPDYMPLAKGLGLPRPAEKLFSENDPEVDKFKYILLFHKVQEQQPLPKKNLQVVQQADFFTLYRNLSYAPYKPVR